MNRSQLNIGIALSLIILAVTMRVLPHPANFAPITAVAIFGGAYLPRRWAVWLPLLAMILSDLIIGMHELILVTWGSYALIAFASSRLLKKVTFARVGTLTLGAATFFFLASNFAVWLTSGMYAHTLVGLQQCFTLALPFFRNSLMGDMFYMAALFGLYGFAVRTSLKTAHAEMREA